METKDKIINLLKDWKVNTHKQELIADDIVCLFNEQSKQMQQRIKELEEVITKALNISHLWTYSDTISESQEQEARALRSMEDSFQTALNNKQL
jgi:hypothetical protein